MHEMHLQSQAGTSRPERSISESKIQELEVLEREIQALEQEYIKEKMRIKWLKKLTQKYVSVASYAEHFELSDNEQLPIAKEAWQLFASELRSEPSYEAVRETTIGKLDLVKEFERVVRDDDYEASQATIIALITMARKRQEDINVRLKPLYERRAKLDPVAEGTYTGIGARQQAQIESLLDEHAGTKPMPRVSGADEAPDTPVL